MNYLDIIKDITKPTVEETEWFIRSFTEAHSWYKHIDRQNPEQFVFYIDPNPDFINSTGSCWNYLPIRYTQRVEILDAKPNTEDGKIKRIYIKYHDEILIMPETTIEKCSIGLTGCIHNGFKYMHDTKLLPGDELTCHDRHINDIEKLRKHLFYLLDWFYY